MLNMFREIAAKVGRGIGRGKGAGQSNFGWSRPKNSGRFAAVAIRPGLMCCKFVRRYTNRKMLEKDAPTLPVAGCDELQCQCRFVKFTDRRDTQERRLPYAAESSSRLSVDRERRTQNDRRWGKKLSKPRAYYNDY
jgi:hypothetical protein